MPIPGDESNSPETKRTSLSRRNNAQWIIAGFLFTALATGALLYRFLMDQGLGHTSLLFLGIPLVLAILLVLAPTPKSATGSILRGMVLALLIIAPLVGEGYFCILFASPLFLIMGLVVGLLVDHSRAKRSTTLSCVVVFMLPFCLEGVAPQLTHDRLESVQVTEIVGTPESQVEASLARSPRLSTALPLFLRMGFPRPVEVHGSGLKINDLRVIHFTGAEGDPPGDLVMRVTAGSPGLIRFETVSDSSKLRQWVRWRSSDVTYRPIDSTHTRVTWSICFERQLDPYWYFAPWERLAVHEAATYLIRANTMPGE